SFSFALPTAARCERPKGASARWSLMLPIRAAAASGAQGDFGGGEYHQFRVHILTAHRVIQHAAKRGGRMAITAEIGG
ncbi:MAG: hypothetical protein EAZ92_17925, partial [Candidatus Kapaibacterium sp.]